jgi:hypothetical protein
MIWLFFVSIIRQVIFLFIKCFSRVNVKSHIEWIIEVVDIT